MTYDGFATASEFIRLRLEEANRDARRLGHSLEEWRNAGQSWTTYCRNCGDRATVRPKGPAGLKAAEIGGPATVFRCPVKPIPVVPMPKGWRGI